MKQMKFFLLALTVLMGVSFTSCLDNDDDGMRIAGDVFRANMMGTSFTDATGRKWVPTAPVMVEGNMYYINFQYNQKQYDPNSKTAEMTILSNMCIDGEVVRNTPVMEENAPIYAFSANYPIPYLFDSHTLTVPFFYWVKDTEDEAKKHKFILYYDNAAINEGDTELHVYLTHVIDDTDITGRNKYTTEYKAFDLQAALYEFQNKAGNKPSKVILHAKTNDQSNTLDNAKDGKVSLDYKSE